MNNFKLYISIVLLMVYSTVAIAQIDRTHAPKPGPAPEINLGKYEHFELKNGLKVFVVENHKIPRVSFNLRIERDPIFEGEKAGFVSISGDLMRTGTASRTKAQIDEEVDFIAASLSTSSTGIFASSLTKHQDKLLELMTDVLYNPSFPEDELEKLKKQTISGLAASKDDPNSIASNVQNALVFGKTHPYGELMTEENVEKITIDDCRSYYSTYFKPNVSYLAIVGDINMKEAKKIARKYFGKWEPGDVPSFKYKQPESPEKTIIALVDRPNSVQSVIRISYPVDLKPGSQYVIQSKVMNHILGGSFSSRLMQNLREDKAFTYGARSSLSSDKLIGSFTASASVRNEVTDSAVYEFLYELKRIENEKVTEEDLNASKAYMTGSFARSLENPQTIAGFALNTAIYGLPEDYYANYLKNLSDVSVDNIVQMAKKYIQPDRAYIVVVGKASEIADGLKRFGEVQYYDIYGNHVVPSDAQPLPEGLTADEVYATYVDALGGREKLENVKNISMKMKAEMMGQLLDLNLVKEAPNKMKQETEMNGMVVSKVVFDGNELINEQMGNRMPVDENMKKEMVAEAGLFPELYYAESEIKSNLTGIEKIGEENAYVIELTFPEGSKKTMYYSIKTGLMLRTSKVIDTPQGSATQVTDYKNYKEVDGIMFPFEIVQKFGPTEFKTEVLTIELNKELPPNTFSIE